MSISVVLTVHNKQDLIKNVVHSILWNCSELVKEFIVVLDGCTDNSESIILHVLKMYKFSKISNETRRHLEDNLQVGSGEMILTSEGTDLRVKIIKTADVYEIRANNAGLKASTCEYSIIFQDDMIVKEKDFDKRMIKPLQVYDDLFAVTARNSHNIYIREGMTEDCDVVGGPVGDKFDNLYKIPNDFDRNTIHIKMVINRGPIAFDNRKLRQLNYFDESLPGIICCDDHDLCIRARLDFNWKCGAYWIWYESREEWGTTRNHTPQKSKFWGEQNMMNRKELYKRYGTKIPSLILNEIRKINN